jgi:hypothetical protein
MCYWPGGLERKVTVECFIRAFQTIGYEICKNGEVEEEFEKIAIYTDNSDKPTHAARQTYSGKWTSKLGQAVDIEHEMAESLVSVEYGKVKIFMKRRRPKPAH